MRHTLSREEAIAIRDRSRREPSWWVKHILGQSLWPIQKQILNSIRDNPRTAVAACHAIGKSFITACAVTHFLQSYKNSVVILTAPTWRQVEQVVWREICRVYAESVVELPGRPLQTPRWDIDREKYPKWYALGASARDNEKFAGFHAPYILVVVDEASGVPNEIFDAIRGLMSTGYVRLLMLGNPTRPDGEFHRAFTSSRHMYKCFQVSAWDTPNLAPIKEACENARTDQERWAILRSAPVPRPYLVAPAWVADMEEEFGRDSDIYRVRVLGQFPLGGPDQLIPLGHVVAAADRWEERFFCETPSKRELAWWLERAKFSGYPIAGLDVARYGDAESVLCPRLDDVVAPLKIWTGADSVELAGYVEEYSRPLALGEVRVDSAGYGGGPYDNLCRLMAGVIPMNVVVPAMNTERFANLRAEAFWGLKDRFREGNICIPRDERLIGQLTSMKYKHRPNNQIIIESKDEMRARGLKSPDRADALMLAFAGRGTSGAPPAQSVSSLTDWGGMYGNGY